MTAPTLSAYPRTIDDLLPDARALAEWLGEVPSRNRLMRDLRIGADKAVEIRERLLDELAPPDPWQHAEPIADPTPDPEQTDPTPESQPDPDPAPAEPQPAEVAAPAAGTDPQATPDVDPGTLSQLKRIRWGVRAVLTLGVAASVAGNVLHAQDHIISQIISAWPPLALLLTVELISRVPVHTRVLAWVRWLATAAIAGIAAWVSYWHMAAVASAYGESGGSEYLIPLSVDGLVVVASICLVELGGRIADRQVTR